MPHFPRRVLDEVGAWDPFNVTEDADLGIRLARRGYRVEVLPSTTWEEAPVSLRAWRNQRTRWLKGWMQTFNRSIASILSRNSRMIPSRQIELVSQTP